MSRLWKRLIMSNLAAPAQNAQGLYQERTAMEKFKNGAFRKINMKGKFGREYYCIILDRADGAVRIFSHLGEFVLLKEDEIAHVASTRNLSKQSKARMKEACRVFRIRRKMLARRREEDAWYLSQEASFSRENMASAARDMKHYQTEGLIVNALPFPLDDAWNLEINETVPCAQLTKECIVKKDPDAVSFVKKTPDGTRQMREEPHRHMDYVQLLQENEENLPVKSKPEQWLALDESGALVYHIAYTIPFPEGASQEEIRKAVRDFAGTEMPGKSPDDIC